MIGQTIAHYKITAKLGAGGMGEVYLAIDTNLDRQVAIKFLSADRSADPEARQRFIHEAKAQAMLSHPNIATFHDVGEERGRAFLVMEYVEGQPLPELARDEKLSLPEILDIVIQVGDGLQSAHEHGVVHRDIKPENILVTAKRHVKITDFGLARWKGATTLTKSGTRLGTVYYMSPEQAEGKRVDHRSDVFSLGVVLYELLCNQRPFEGDTEPAILYELTSKTPEPMARYRRDATDALERIVSKCLAKNPEERYQSCADLVADLRREQKASEAVGATAAPPVVQRRRGRGLVISGSAVAVIALVLFVLKPWQIEVGPTKEAAATENRLAVMYFDNLVDPEDSSLLGEITANLVMSDLSTSSCLQVVSSQRLYDVLKLLGKEGVKQVDRETATHVAQRTKARWMLTGSILRLEPSIVLSAQLVDVESGSIIASPTVTGSAGQDIFVIVDSLTPQIKEHLALPAEALAEEDYGVAELTTTSTEAYRHYLRGWGFYYQIQFIKAAEEFGKAVQADTYFAMAYYGLSFVAAGHADIKKEMVANARAYMDHLSDDNRLRILAREAELNEEFGTAIGYLEELVEKSPEDKYALDQLGTIYYERWNSREAIPLYLKAIEIDPLFAEAYNMLSGCYEAVGEMDKAIWAANKYVELAPAEPNPYDSRAELHGEMGQLDAAIASYKQALEIDSQFTYSLAGLIRMYTFKGDYAAAEDVLQRQLKHPSRDVRSGARWQRVWISFYQGRLAEAVRRAQYAVETDILEYREDRPSWQNSYLLKFIYMHLSELTGEPQWEDSLQAHIDRVTTSILQDTSSDRFDRADAYSDRAIYASRWADGIGSDSNLHRMFTLLDTSVHVMERDLYGVTLFFVKFYRGEYDSAITHFLKYAMYERDFSIDIWLGRAYLLAGRLGEAVEALERARTQYDRSRFYDAPSSVRLHYWLGLAYEQSGWRGKAIEQYGTFLEIWKDADKGIIDLEDARVRLARLKGQAG